eukprot:tig00021589_g22756.t1
MTKGHSMMDIGEGSKKQRQALKNDLKADMDGIVNKFLPARSCPRRGAWAQRGETKTLPAMKYTPSMEKLMRMGIRQQLQNANPGRTINEEDVENAFSLRKEIMIRDFDQWAMTAFDLKQPGVAKMLEEYYPELLERITNMIEQDIEIQRFDKYQKVFFPMNYDDLVMKWARERGWIKTMEEIEKENLLGRPAATGRRRRTPRGCARATPPIYRPCSTRRRPTSAAPSTSPTAATTWTSAGAIRLGRCSSISGDARPGPATAMPYADQNLLPRVVNPLPALQGNQLATPFQKGRMLELRAKGTVAGMSAASQTAIQTAFQSIVRNTENNQIAMLAETNARKAEMFDQAAQALRLGQ